MAKGATGRLLVDAGDLLFKERIVQAAKRDAAEAAAATLVDELKRTGATALVPGERDLALGLPAYRARMKAAGLTVLAANLLAADSSEAPFPGSTVVPVGTLQVGLVGLVGQRPFEGVPGVTVTNPAAALTREVQAVRAAGADVVVLLAHAEMRELQALLAKPAGVHFAVAGHERRKLQRVRQAGAAQLVTGGDRGRQVGHLRLTVNGPPYTFTDGGEVVAAEREIALLAGRQSYYEKRLKAEGAGGRPERVGFYQERLGELKKERAGLEQALQAARRRPVKGNRFELTMAPMDRSLPDDPAAAERVARCKAAIAKLGGPAPVRPETTRHP